MKRSIACILTFMALIMPIISGTAAFAGDVETVLKMDTGGHMAIVRKMILTNDGRFLVSASDDKTVRVWDAVSKREVRKILGQIDTGTEGMVFAVALSPDNSRLAVGGYFNCCGNTDYGDIRIYDARTGKLLQLLKSHTNVVLDLNYSKDGRYLVSGSTDQTVKVWDAGNGYSLVHTFKDHKGQVYGANIFQYNNDYRIVSAGYDNRAILYSLNSRSVINSYTHGYKLQYMAMSGRHIAASGFQDKSILVFDLNLNLVATVPLETVSAGLAFSPDGRVLATGAYEYPRNSFAFDANNGFRKLSAFPKNNNLTMAVTFLDNSTVVTAGGENYDIFMWDPFTGAEKGHIAGDGLRNWAVGLKGREIAFGQQWGGGDTHLHTTQINKSFNLDTFTVSNNIDASSFKRMPLTYGSYSLTHEAGGDYGYKDATLIIKNNGQEVSRVVRDTTNGLEHFSYGFVLDGKIISGGANGRMKAYNVQGEQIADFVGHTGVIWGVAVDGEYLATASDDQTLRLWSLRDLKEGKSVITPVVSVFVSKGDEWVVWSNSGYYTSSVGGDRYIGFHVNQGPQKEALFYSSDRFFKTYYNPELVQSIIKLGSEAKAIEYAGRGKAVEKVVTADILPPLIRINSPATAQVKTDKDSIVIDFDVIPQSQDEITDVTILLNDRPLKDRSIGKKEVAKELQAATAKQGTHVVKEIPITERKNTITILASSSHATSNPYTIEVEKTFLEVQDIFKPTLYVLSVGVSQYKNPEYNLKYAKADADSISGLFKAQEGKLYKKVIVKSLSDREATNTNILDAIEWLDRETTQKDLAIIFIAGHGVNDAKGAYYFLSHNADANSLRSTAVRWTEFEDLVKTLPSKVILLVDTCHSGSITGGGRRAINSDITAALKSIVAAGTGQIIMTATTGSAYSYERDELKHGIFTKAIIEGLAEGKADFDHNNQITVKELDFYVTERVKALSNGQQKPTTIIPNSIPDFSLYVK